MGDSEKSYKSTNGFLTHNWRKDSKGRDNHERVAVVNDRLNRRGYTTWFDAKKMTGQIRERMAEGVDNTDCVIVFVTTEYMRKLNTRDLADNCYFEYHRAVQQRTAENMLCVIMEEEMMDQRKWVGPLKEDLGNTLFVTMHKDFIDEKYLKQQMDELVDQLRLKSVFPAQLTKQCPSCTVTDDDKNTHFLCIDGKYCTYCSSPLVEKETPKNFCECCNIHAVGRYCSECQLDLLDESMKLLNIQEEYRKHVPLTYRVSEKKETYTNLCDESKALVESIRNDMEVLKRLRDNSRLKGETLQLEDNGFKDEIDAMNKDIDDLLSSGSSIPSSADVCCSMEPIYDDKLGNLLAGMEDLVKERKMLQDKAALLIRVTDSVAESQKKLKEKMSKLNDSAVRVQDKPQQVHDRRCTCNECSFERELNQQMVISGPDFLKSLIIENRISDVKLSLNLQKNIVEMKDEDDKLNLLLLLAAKFGSVEMMKLIESVVAVNEVTDDGQTALHFAAKVDTTRYLCTRYPQMLTVRNAEGFTPLMKAFCESKDDVVCTMKEFIADPDEEINDYIAIATSRFREQGFSYIERLIKENDIESMRRLIAVQPDIISMRNNEKETPLIRAAQYSTCGMVQLLVEHGADLTVAAKHKNPLIMFVVANQEHGVEICKYICAIAPPEIITAKNFFGFSVFRGLGFQASYKTAADEAHGLEILGEILAHPTPELTAQLKKDAKILKLGGQKCNAGVKKLIKEYLEAQKFQSDSKAK